MSERRRSGMKGKKVNAVENRKHLHDERRLTVRNTIVSLIDMDSREARNTWAKSIRHPDNLVLDLSWLARPDIRLLGVSFHLCTTATSASVIAIIIIMGVGKLFLKRNLVAVTFRQGTLEL